MVKEGALAPLVALLGSGTPVAKQNAAGVLWNLAINADNKVAITEAGGIDALEVLTRSNSTKVQENAAKVLNNVAMDDFRMTLGAGLRVTIPAMGPAPIAVDWGIPVIKNDLDNERVFSFYIGINR